MQRFKMPVAVHLFLIKDNKILLLRRYNTGYEDGNYSVCAGHIDGDELYYEAMIREAKEEINVEIKKEDLSVIQLMHRKSKEERIDYFFIARKWHGEIINNEPDKCDELIWVDLSGLPENIVPYIKEAIYNYQNNITFTDFGW
jgi:ADP-ribose pyrophosphatase YjhB (NUDIX family)